MTDKSHLKETITDAARVGGQLLLDYFGHVTKSERKQDQSNIVTEADVAAEKAIIALIESRHPDCNIISEEAGYKYKKSRATWIIDPLDGTSNFAAGLPWFGVLIAHLQDGIPTHAAMYQPIPNILYYCETDKGVLRNDEMVRVSREPDLSNVLCSYGMDSSPILENTQQQVQLLGRIVNRVRNVRCTHSLVDMCYTVDGRLGAFIFHANKIWDIAPVWLMLKEAGGWLTDLNGKEIQFDLSPDSYSKTYPVIGASKKLHAQIMDIVKESAITVKG